MALDWPFDDGRVQTANVALNASTVLANIMDDLMSIFTGKANFIFSAVQTRRGSRDAVFLTSEGGGRPQSFTQAAPN